MLLRGRGTERETGQLGIETGKWLAVERKAEGAGE